MIFSNLVQAHIHGFDGIGRVDHFANLLRIVKEQGDALPATKPALYDGWIPVIRPFT